MLSRNLSTFASLQLLLLLLLLLRHKTQDTTCTCPACHECYGLLPQGCIGVGIGRQRGAERR